MVNYFFFLEFEYFFVIQKVQTVLVLESFDFMNLYMLRQLMCFQELSSNPSSTFLD